MLGSLKFLSFLSPSNWSKISPRHRIRCFTYWIFEESTWCTYQLDKVKGFRILVQGFLTPLYLVLHCICYKIRFDWLTWRMLLTKAMNGREWPLCRGNFLLRWIWILRRLPSRTSDGAAWTVYYQWWAHPSWSRPRSALGPEAGPWS